MCLVASTKSVRIEAEVEVDEMGKSGLTSRNQDKESRGVEDGSKLKPLISKKGEYEMK